MSRKGKNILTLLILCAVLAACLALYFLASRGGGQEGDGGVAQSGTAEEIAVDAVEAGAVERLEVKKKGKTSYALVKGKGGFAIAGREGAPLDGEKVEALFACLNPVKAAKSLKKTEGAMAEYGLEKPSFTVLVTAGGREYRYDLGIKKTMPFPPFLK